MIDNYDDHQPQSVGVEFPCPACVSSAIVNRPDHTHAKGCLYPDKAAYDAFMAAQPPNPSPATIDIDKQLEQIFLKVLAPYDNLSHMMVCSLEECDKCQSDTHKCNTLSIDQGVALLTDLITEKENRARQKIISLEADIAYAIGHGRGCGHPITYLEKRYPTLKSKGK